MVLIRRYLIFFYKLDSLKIMLLLRISPVLNLNKNTDKVSQPSMNHLNNSNSDDNDSSKEDVTDNLDNDIYIFSNKEIDV